MTLDGGEITSSHLNVRQLLFDDGQKVACTPTTDVRSKTLPKNYALLRTEFINAFR